MPMQYMSKYVIINLLSIYFVNLFAFRHLPLSFIAPCTKISTKTRQTNLRNLKNPKGNSC
ncbi:hypothetical protein CQA40_02945 [Helicobacter sp. MIT 01-3238]|nr:hypothetical protein CQA40_02945 [Helicobacter sp. MIT 01-3238]